MAKNARKTPNKRLQSIKKSQISLRHFLVFAVSFAVIGGLLLIVTKAATPPPAPSIYLTPDSQNLNVGDTFTVSLYEDSGTDDLNALQASLSYPTSQLSYISHTDSSAFPLTAQNPSGDTGSLTFVRGICGGCTTVSGTNLILTITFKALAAGTPSVNFVDGTQLIRSSDNQPEPNLNEAGGTYTIAAPTPPPPPPPTGGGGTTTPPTSPPKSSAPVTQKTTTSTQPVSTTPISNSSPAPAQTSTPTAATAPVASPVESPLIPANIMRLLKIAGVAGILAVSITIFSWAWGRMRNHLRFATHQSIGGGVMAMPPLPPSQPAVTVKPATSTKTLSAPLKTASIPVESDKPQPGSILQPNSTKKP